MLMISNFTFEEYEKLVKENQTEKYGSTIYLTLLTKKNNMHTSNSKKQGYDVLISMGN
jgi:hypothetical protein